MSKRFATSKLPQDERQRIFDELVAPHNGLHPHNAAIVAGFSQNEIDKYDPIIKAIKEYGMVEGFRKVFVTDVYERAGASKMRAVKAIVDRAGLGWSGTTPARNEETRYKYTMKVAEAIGVAAPEEKVSETSDAPYNIQINIMNDNTQKPGNGKDHTAEISA